MGLEGVCKGDIYLNHELINGNGTFISPVDRSIGIIFHVSTLLPNKTALENVILAMSEDFSYQGKLKEAVKLLKAVDMSEHIEKFPSQLSGGQHQRVMIARLLAYKPKLVLLDEPFANLDFHTRILVRDFLLGILRQHKITTILVTHLQMKP